MIMKTTNFSEKMSFILLPLLCFMVPISTFGTTVCLLSVVLLWLATGDYAKKMNLFWQHPVARAFVILMLGAMASLFYTQGETKEIYNGIKDSLRLCAIGVFIYYFLQQSSEELKNKCIQAFIWAMILTVVLSYLKYFFHLLPHKQGLTEAAVFKNHIKTSFYMSIAVYFIIDALSVKPKQIIYWISLILLIPKCQTLPTLLNIRYEGCSFANSSLAQHFDRLVYNCLRPIQTKVFLELKPCLLL